MSIVFILSLTSAPEKYEAFKEFMQKILPDTAGFSGSELVSAYADPETNTLHVHEVWDSRESLKSYQKWRAERGDNELIGAYLAAPPNAQAFEHVPY